MANDLIEAEPPQTKPTSVGMMSERRVGFICGFLAALGPLSLAIYLPALAEVTHYFDTQQSYVQLSVSLFFAGFAVMQLICGPLSDSFGRKSVLIAFLLVYLSGSVTALFADSIWLLIVARVLQGAGSAAGIALSRAIVRDLFTRERAIKIQSGVGIAMALGALVAPTIGGTIVHLSNWHFVFVVMIATGAVAIAVVTLLFRETMAHSRSSARPTMILLTYKRIFCTPRFLSAALVLGGTNGVIYAQSTVLPLVMIQQLGLTPNGFGLFMLSQTLTFIVVTVLVRMLIGRIEAMHITLIGMALLCIVCVSMPALIFNFEITPLMIAIPVGLMGATVAFTMPTLTVAALDSFPENHGAAAAVLGFVQMGSGMTGGLVASLFTDPSVALASITSGMCFVAIVSGLIWHRLARSDISE